MRYAALLLIAAAFCSRASAQTAEALRVSADAALTRALPLAVHPALLAPRVPIFQAPLRPRPIRPVQGNEPVVGKVTLAGIIEKNRHLMNKVFGTRALDLGVAGDASFAKKFLTFSDAKTTTLADLGDLDNLRGPGIDAPIDANTVYHVKLQPNAFNPVRGSTLKMTPLKGTSGPSHPINTGDILDALRAKSFVFKAFNQELWMFYGTDALSDGSGFAGTRSFLFIKENGLSSKAWPLAETKLAVNVPAIVDLDDIHLSLTRTSAGELIIRESR